MICNCSLINTHYNVLSGSNHIYPIAVIHTNCNHTYSECVNYMHLTNDWLIVVQYEQYSVFLTYINRTPVYSERKYWFQCGFI